MSSTPSSNRGPDLFDAIEDAYTKGASDIEICKILKITLSKFEERYARDPSFRELIDIGRMMRRAFWMEFGRVNMTNKHFNRNAWLDYMKNEFGWSDKTEIKTDVKEKSTEELMQELGPTIRKLIDLNLVAEEENNGPHGIN